MGTRSEHRFHSPVFYYPREITDILIMKENLSFESIKPHLKTLQYSGYYQIDPNSPKLKRYLHRGYMALILSLGILYTVQEIIYVVAIGYDPEKVIDTMFLMLTYSAAIYKQLVFWIREEKIEELLAALKGPLFNHNEVGHRELLLKRARQSRLLLRAFNGAALTTCLLWVLYPAILYAKSKPFEFTIWLPFNHDMSPQIYFVLLYTWVQTSYLGMGNTSMDAFITYFFAQCKTQLSILRYDLSNIVQKCENESRQTSKPLSQVFHLRFREIMMHYDEIDNVCNKTQDIFGGAILYLFLVIIWVICTSAYVMTISRMSHAYLYSRKELCLNLESPSYNSQETKSWFSYVNPVSVKFASMCMYMVCILTELFLYCYYGNEVVYESKSLIDSVFGMDWHRIPHKQRYNIIVFMERIKRPMVPMAGAFVPLSNTTFVSILRSSYSFYAFLKNSGTT